MSAKTERFIYKNYIGRYILPIWVINMVTTIQVEKGTLNKLKRFKEYNRESYNEIINKLMKFKEIVEPKLTKQAKIDINDARKEKGIPLSKAIKELGVDIDL